MARAPSLRLRRTPRQPRSRATVEAILDATAGLLREVGADRLTTNAIAERAGINVASLYAYFPNKFAILASLWERMQIRQQELLRGLERPGSLASAIDEGVDATLAFVLREPGFVELADAVRVMPELRELSPRAHRDAAVLLGELIARRREAPSAGDLDAMATVIVEATSAVLAHARRAPASRRKRILGELKRMLGAYLGA